MNISTAQTCKIFDLSDRLPTGIQITKQPKRKKVIEMLLQNIQQAGRSLQAGSDLMI